MRIQHQKVQLARNFLVGLFIVSGIFILLPSFFLVREYTARSNASNAQVAISLSATLPDTGTAGNSGIGAVSAAIYKAANTLALNDERELLMKHIDAAKELIQNPFLTSALRQELSEKATRISSQIQEMNLEQTKAANKELSAVITRAEKQIQERIALDDAVHALQQLINRANDLIPNTQVHPDNRELLRHWVTDAQELLAKDKLTSAQVTSFSQRFQQEIERVDGQVKDEPFQTPEQIEQERIQKIMEQAAVDASWFNALNENQRRAAIENADGTIERETNVIGLTYQDRGLILGLETGIYVAVTSNNPDLMYLFMTANVPRVFRTTRDAQDAGFTNILDAANKTQLIDKARALYKATTNTTNETSNSSEEPTQNTQTNQTQTEGD